MPQPYVPPGLKKAAFNCPLCGAYAQHRWFLMVRVGGGSRTHLSEFDASSCTHCKEWLYWHKGAIIVPDVSSAPAANEDLNEDIKQDYAEAASIAAKSPRGAAALLRLCVQKLCKQLGEQGNDINKDIGALVKKGLDVRVQKALDTVRVLGNEAVHPGELNLKDDRETVGKLFALVNAIANDMITQPRFRNELYQMLPEKKLDGIAVRDASKGT